MKRLLLMVSVPVLMATSICSFASGVGVVDMKQIFQASPQIKQINETLKTQFADRKAKLDAEGKTLQADIQTYTKNKAVMNSKSLAALQDKITQEQRQLQQADVQFQKDVYAAQNTKTSEFLNEIKTIVKNIAVADDLDVVMPKGALLYSKDDRDITAKVVAELQKSK